MSLLNDLRKFGKKTVKDAKKRTEERKSQQERANLLAFLSKDDLISLALEHNASISKTMTKEGIIDELSQAEKLTLENIKGHIKKKRTEDTKSKLTTIKATKGMEVEQEIVRTEKIKTRIREVSTIEKKIERTLKNYVPTGKLRNERELEVSLSARLASVFGHENIQTQAPLEHGKVDIVINREYAIELKMPSTYGELIKSEGPISHYADSFKKVFFYIYDIKRVLTPTEKKEIAKKLPSNVEIIVK